MCTGRMWSSCDGGWGGDSERRGSGLGLVDRLLDLDDRDGVRGREEKRLRLVITLNALGASDELCFSSSEPPRMLLGGSEGRCDILDEVDAAEMDDGERETGMAGSLDALPFDDDSPSAASWLRLTQLLSRCNSIAGRRLPDVLPCFGSSCSTTTAGRELGRGETGFSSAIGDGVVA